MVGRRTAPRVLTDTGGYSAFASGRGISLSISAESLGRSARVYDDADNGVWSRRAVAPAPPPFMAPSAAAAAAAIY